jgi:hypothetical protein
MVPPKSSDPKSTLNENSLDSGGIHDQADDGWIVIRVTLILLLALCPVGGQPLAGQGFAVPMVKIGHFRFFVATNING